MYSRSNNEPVRSSRLHLSYDLDRAIVKQCVAGDDLVLTFKGPNGLGWHTEEGRLVTLDTEFDDALEYLD